MFEALFHLLRLPLLVGALLCSAPALAERTITDMAGRQVALPKLIHKVYAVGHCVPLIWAIAPDKLGNHGRMPDAAARYLPPAFFAGKTAPAQGKGLSDEEILKMAPDLIVIERAPSANDQAERISARLRIPVIVVDQDMDRYRQSFAFLGEVLARKEQASILSDFVARWLEPVREQAKLIPEARRARVYYAEGPDGLSTNPGSSAHTQVLDYVGALNVARVNNAPGEGTAAVSPEQLLLWQAQWILVATPGADTLTTWRAIRSGEAWQRLEAVRQGHLVQIPWQPFSWFDRPPGSNRILGALWLAHLLYPDLFHYDLVALTREYFEKFYHLRLSAEQARALLASAHP